MEEESCKVLKAEIGKIPSQELEVFKSMLIPFEGTVESYNESDETAVVNFKNAVEKKHLEGLGAYAVKALQTETSKTAGQSLRKRDRNVVADRVLVNEYDIINIFLDATIFAPVLCVLLSILLIFSLF